MTKSPYQILQKPIITEKALDAKERARTLCFQVNPHSTKTEIKQAVQTLFKVKVESVRTAFFRARCGGAGERLVFGPIGRKLT